MPLGDSGGGEGFFGVVACSWFLLWGFWVGCDSFGFGVWGGCGGFSGSWVLLVGLIGVDWMTGRRGDVRIFFPGHFGRAAAGVEGDVEAVFVFHGGR